MEWPGLWRWDGTVDRGPFVIVGVLGFALKHNLDRLVATLYRRPWGLFNYVLPEPRTGISSFTPDDWMFYGSLVALALPFIWVGVGMTLRRLRACRLPTGLISLFFVPLVNLIFFLVLSVIPTHREELPRGGPVTERLRRDPLARLIPTTAMGSAGLALLVTPIVGIPLVLLSTLYLQEYGWGLFVGLPFCLGMGSVMLYSYHGRRSFATCMAVAILSIALLGLLLVALAVEGVFCIAMASPIAAALAMLGGAFGYLLQLRVAPADYVVRTLGALLLAAPLIMGAEYVDPPVTPMLEAQSSVEIAADPAVVWRHVVSFADLPPPTEWLFRIGIAYPKRAEIEGTGPGAIRRCVFSTGAFVEPIEVWDEPRLLKFGVASNPAPMEEWTPYRRVRPPHLEGFFLSRAGQFRLVPLPDGGTRLEGTTWYVHHMWPAWYWGLWSDAVIHQIHLRVLRHIRELAESEARSGTTEAEPR